MSGTYKNLAARDRAKLLIIGTFSDQTSFFMLEK